MNNYYIETISVLLFTLVIFFTACQEHVTQRPAARDLSITWQLLGNTGENHSASFKIINQSDTILSAKNWALYFNQLPRALQTIESEFLTMRRINGDFFEIAPKPNFEGLAAGDSISITYTSPYWATKETDAPCGLYFAFDNGNTLEVVENYTVLPFTEPSQYLRSPNDKVLPPNANDIFAANELLAKQADELPPFLPTPIQYKYKKRNFSINNNTSIVVSDPLLTKEANYLSLRLLTTLGVQPTILDTNTKSSNKIVISLRKRAIKGESDAAYSLDIDNKKGIMIEGTDPAGVFYGIQSLLQMFPPSTFSQSMSEISLKEIIIKDAPAFAYRGMHLDVSRNFHSKAEILKLLDIMALYKLNKFHFHLTDDEGWRVEIAPLQELTNYGSNRGHTLNESEQLFPAYGSGPFNDYPGSGYYSREDFIEILKFADERHIEVIPEIDMPGHARAAIKAMEYRYKNLKEAGNDAAANAFLLSDAQDTSNYESVQGYTDNVICVGQESTYDFLEVVIAEMVSMYKSAGIKLKTVHTGKSDKIKYYLWYLQM